MRIREAQNPGNALEMPLVLRVSVGGVNAYHHSICLLLCPFFHKKIKNKRFVTIFYLACNFYMYVFGANLYLNINLVVHDIQGSKEARIQLFLRLF